MLALYMREQARQGSRLNVEWSIVTGTYFALSVERVEVLSCVLLACVVLCAQSTLVLAHLAFDFVLGVMLDESGDMTSFCSCLPGVDLVEWVDVACELLMKSIMRNAQV